MSNTKKVHISTIKAGDTVLCLDGYERTVCPKDIKFDTFRGITLFGDCYKLGYQLVDLVLL